MKLRHKKRSTAAHAFADAAVDYLEEASAEAPSESRETAARLLLAGGSALLSVQLGADGSVQALTLVYGPGPETPVKLHHLVMPAKRK